MTLLLGRYQWLDGALCAGSVRSGRSCQHRLGRNADDDVAGEGAVRLRNRVVVVAGEQDACAVPELGAEQCRSNAEELLILVIPDLRDALDADCVHVLLLCWLLLRRVLRNDLGRPGAMAGLCGALLRRRAQPCPPSSSADTAQFDLEAARSEAPAHIVNATRPWVVPSSRSRTALGASMYG